jgi:hypothetical protein
MIGVYPISRPLMTFTRYEPVVSSEASLHDSHGTSQAISAFINILSATNTRSELTLITL